MEIILESTGEPLRILPLRVSQLEKYRAELGEYTGIGDKGLKGVAISDSIVDQCKFIHKIQEERHKRKIDLLDFLGSIDTNQMKELWSALLGQDAKNAQSPA